MFWNKIKFFFVLPEEQLFWICMKQYALVTEKHLLSQSTQNMHLLTTVFLLQLQRTCTSLSVFSFA